MYNENLIPLPPTPQERHARLRALLTEKTVVLPGAINALSAKLIEQQGFDALYLSGAVLANSVGGMPDVGLMTLSEAAAHAGHIANAVQIPIIMDADTGYGEAGNAARTVHVLEQLGVSGIHLEDQVFPKRCGHLEGKTLVETSTFCDKLATAAAARRDSNFLLIARTDARSVLGYDAAVERAHAYLAAGADAVFPEALEGADEFARFARDVPAPLLANMTEFGKTPYLTVDAFSAMGYKMVIFPVTLQRVAMYAMHEALRTLKQDGGQETLLERMQTREALYDLLAYNGRVDT